MDNCAQVESLTGQLELEVLGSRIIIIEDEFRSGYECKKCDGDGEIFDEPCITCGGQGTNRHGTICPDCNGDKTVGKQVCPECKGKGGTIVIQQDAQRRPTTGIIASVGEDCKRLKNGMKVLYSNFAGTAIEFRTQVTVGKPFRKRILRIMEEHEVYALMHGGGSIGDRAR